MNAAELAAGWPGGAKRRDAWMDVRCTAAEHGGDARASLSLTDDHDKGRVRTVCRKGCSFKSIVEGSPFNVGDFFHVANGNGHSRAPATATHEATYDYRDTTGALRCQTVRMRRHDGAKDFYQRRPDGNGGWINNLRDIETVIYRLDTLADELAWLPEGQRLVAVVEGEKDVDSLAALGIPATCNPMGAGKWREHHTRQLAAAGAEGAYVFRDADTAGEAHAAAVTRALLAPGLVVKRIILPGLEAVAAKHGADVTDWLTTHTADDLRAVLTSATTTAAAATSTPPRRATPWDAARSASDFVEETDETLDWLFEPILAPGSITEIFAPRGLGKTHAAYGITVPLAKAGRRVLLLDRDNSRREVRRRLRAWGVAGATTFKVMTRDEVPPLTDEAAWAVFPFKDYDVLIVDSLDAASEGVGEKDSSKPSKAIAPLLDIAHRADGPAILVLGNTIKSGANSRGSGVVEDRSDICFEVRDATDLKPTGTKDWWQELPAAGREAWAERASRRRRRDTYRLAFISSKFRTGEEPDPFALEIDLSGDLWTLRNATADVIAAGAAAQEEAEAERAAQRAAASDLLAAEVARRVKLGAAPLRHGEAVDYLKDGAGLKRKEARRVVDDGAGQRWTIRPAAGKGGPLQLFPAEGHTETTAAEMRDAESPLNTRAPQAPFLPTRINTGRQKSDAEKSAEMAGNLAVATLPEFEDVQL